MTAETFDKYGFAHDAWQVGLPDGSQLSLRRLRLDDAEEYRAAVLETVAELTRWFDWCHAEWTLEECRSLIEQFTAADRGGQSYSFVARDAKGQIAGATWLNRLDPLHRFGNLGYWVRASHPGRGIATAIAASLAQYGFEQLGLTRVEIVVDVENEASQRVAHKLRARREGILRWRLVHHGQPHDAVMYSLVPPRKTLAP